MTLTAATMFEHDVCPYAGSTIIIADTKVAVTSRNATKMSGPGCSTTHAVVA